MEPNTAGVEGRLLRTLNFPMLVLYGVGTTVGAGVYALLGEISAKAGALAPWAFLLASLLAGFTALSFAELARRYPQSAATARYVEEGLRLKWLGLLVGLLVTLAGIVSSAALLNGMVNYLQLHLAVAAPVLVIAVAALMTLVACWGIAQSVWIAAIVCLVEVGGLIWLSALSAAAVDLQNVDWAPMVPRIEAFPAVVTAAVLAFYAYIGFEDMVEVAEEVKDVTKTLPRAIITTLILTTVLYLVLVVSAQLAVSATTLAGFKAPLADLYQALTQREPVLISAISVLAIVNGVLVQLIMASRVVYGLASRGHLPATLRYVHPRTRTPLVATLLVGLLIVTFALFGSLAGLAEFTSVVMLVVFALANLSLWRLKAGTRRSAGDRVPRLVPLAGFVICTAVAMRSVWLAITG
ncbi:MAG: APC family permease [Pseudomonadales bacterium]